MRREEECWGFEERENRVEWLPRIWEDELREYSVCAHDLKCDQGIITACSSPCSIVR